MALVDYSGSESSDDEEKSVIKEQIKPKTVSTKPAFLKVVDSSNPHKIRVSLPEPARPHQDSEGLERPSKRAKIGSEGLSGFNALLPAPKRAAAPNGGAPFIGSRKGGLRSGVSLITGAAPGFSREIEPSIGEAETNEVDRSPPNVSGLSEGQNPIQGSNPQKVVSSLENDIKAPETKPAGKSTMFKPLSVARKPQKKKVIPLNGSSGSKSYDVSLPPQEKPTSKVSLFSAGESQEVSSNCSTTKGTYQPMIYQSGITELAASTSDVHSENDYGEPSNSVPQSESTAAAVQSLDTIASDLNLSASAKRQLLGRQRNNPSAVNIVNFSTDEEYKANEAARHSGEQVQHNPVRAIAPGKHSLKQLVNMGTLQADALEESFASGRRNRSEAGSKYGW